MSKYLVVKGSSPDWIEKANTLAGVKKAIKELKKTYGKSKVQVFKRIT